MRLKLKVISKIEDNIIFGHYKAIYLDDKSFKVSCGAETSGKTIECFVNKGDLVTLDILAIKGRFLKEIPLNSILDLECVTSIVAKNPVNGVAINATNLLWIG